jgi:hypothetical protein
MTLFIAILLLIQLKASFVWYLFAIILWIYTLD